MKRGKFIVFEGIDGAGKSSICRALLDKFSSIDKEAVHTFEPTSNFIGSTIRKIITKDLVSDEKTIAALFLADRLDHIQNPAYGMLQMLERGINVICDRYYLSSYAYHVPHVSLDWVIDANSVCAELLRPDVIFYIDISVATSLERISSSRASVDLYESEERITLVRDNYLNAIEAVKGDENIVIIDGEQCFEDVVDAVWRELAVGL